MAARHFRPVPALLVVLLLLVMAGCNVSTADGSLARVRAEGKIAFGVDPSFPPFASLDARGRPDGYEIELANAIGERIGVSTHFVGIDVGGIVDALLARKVDVVISGLSPDASIGKRVVFSRPYFNNGQVVIARQGSPTGLASLAGRHVAVESGSNADLELRQRSSQIPNLRIRPFTTLDLALDAVRLGEVDAAVADAVSAIEFIRRSGGLVAGDPFTTEYYAAALRSDDSSLLDALDKALDALDQEGYLDALQTKWLR